MASKVEAKLIEKFGADNKTFADSLNKHGMTAMAEMVGCSRQMVYNIARLKVRSMYVALKEMEIADDNGGS